MEVSTMQKLLLAAAAVAARGDESNPLAKVIELMDDCTAKVEADGEAAEKVFKEYFEGQFLNFWRIQGQLSAVGLRLRNSSARV